MEIRSMKTRYETKSAEGQHFFRIDGDAGVCEGTAADLVDVIEAEHASAMQGAAMLKVVADFFAANGDEDAR